MKRTVYLFGAGAAIGWGGPKTSCLTKLICKRGFKNKKGEFITQVIFDWLRAQSGMDEYDINFETIINVIEDITEYHLKTSNIQINGLAFLLQNLEDEVWDDLFNFEVIEEDKEGAYTLRIPYEDEVLKSQLENIDRQENPNPKAVYYETLLRVLFTEIQDQIIEYSYVTSSHSSTLNKPNFNEINSLAISYFKKESKNCYLRVYNLNYDRVFQFLFENAGLKADQGFNDDKLLPNHIVHFNPMRILKKVNENCIYHLHGSVFWDVVKEDSNGLPDYKFVHLADPSYQINEGFGKYEMEKGKALLIGNIITGYRKAQRTSLSPFRQIFNAFDKDCYTCDKLIIVGYSFGDNHINDIINRASWKIPSELGSRA